MKLFFHSDHTTFNNPVDKKIFSLLNPKLARIGYIPSVSDPTRKYFNRTKDWYKKYGVKNYQYFDLGEEYNERDIEKLLSCDLIHLSGGDTIEFAKNIKKRDFKKTLKQFLDKGGILVGISAGSYVMTPHFEIKRVVYTEEVYKDEDLQGMGLVDFEFLPHLQVKRHLIEKFIDYSKINEERTIYLCEDNNGIFVDDGKIEILGEVLILKNGELIK